MNSPEHLHGVWQATSAVINGQALPDEAVDAIRLTLTRTRFITQRGSETLFDSSYKIDSTTSPKQIEMMGVEDFEGKPALGIYEYEGETLQLCYKMPGFVRPTEFTSPPGSGAFLISLKRLDLRRDSPL